MASAPKRRCLARDERSAGLPLPPAGCTLHPATSPVGTVLVSGDPSRGCRSRRISQVLYIERSSQEINHTGPTCPTPEKSLMAKGSATAGEEKAGPSMPGDACQAGRILTLL